MGRGRRVAFGRRTSRRVCDDCVSMLTPPEELGAAPARARARDAALPVRRDFKRTSPTPASSTVRARTTTTVALVPPAWGLRMRMMGLALAALAFAAAGAAWLFFSSSLR
jgi:hypothetical protein